MEKRNYVDALKTYGSVIAVISAITMGVLWLTDGSNYYYCQSREMIEKFDRLSSTSITGYYGNISKRCPEGWVKVSNLQNITEQVAPNVMPNLKITKCSEVKEDTPIYTICIDEDGRKNYAGEVR